MSEASVVKINSTAQSPSTKEKGKDKKNGVIPYQRLR